ncbi:hypothetical protein TFLX_06271 [Thermoflexales bacterium]|nr:hypothetical protein TFLX_06271 [Thermoflexales bacterium]
MDIVVLVLRLLHIFGGIFWVGASFMLVGFISPAVQASGQVGGQVMQRLMTGSRFSSIFGLSAMVTMLAGVLLYWRVSGGLQLAWITTAPGLALTIGSLAGIAAGVIGGGVAGRTGEKIGQLNAQLGHNQGAPSEAQLSELQGLQQKMKRAQRLSVGLMIIAVVGMAIARYL